MPRTRIRPVASMAIYRTGEAGSPLLEDATYGKVQQFTLPVPAQAFLEVETHGVTDKEPIGFELPDFAITLTDYAFGPERLLDRQLHYFESKAIVAGAGQNGSRALVPARIHAYAMSVDYGTIRIGELTPMIVNITPIEFWVKRIGTNAAFTGTRPTSDDYLRLNVRQLIHWADGRDMYAEENALLGRSG